MIKMNLLLRQDASAVGPGELETARVSGAGLMGGLPWLPDFLKPPGFL